jgi:hypothetical protein
MALMGTVLRLIQNEVQLRDEAKEEPDDDEKR